MADEEDAPAPGPATVADIGAAILQGVQLLQQHSVEAPTFVLKDARDVYKEGVRAVKSRAPPARVIQQWMDAVSGLPAPKPADVERAVTALGGEAGVAGVIVETYKAVTAPRLAKAPLRRVARVTFEDGSTCDCSPSDEWPAMHPVSPPRSEAPPTRWVFETPST